MKLVNFEASHGPQAGVVFGQKIIGLSDVPGFEAVRSVDELLASDRLDELRAELASNHPREGVDLGGVKIRSPISAPDKILCAAVNYVSHGKEHGVAPPREPYFFTKFRSCIIGHGDAILLPRVSAKVDWEAELAVVIGKKGKYIRQEDALEYVAGYTAANDVSFRDLQFAGGAQGPNWVKGKALDGALPLGPWLVTKDEIPDPQEVRISLSVNGVRRQDSTTGEMVFTVRQLIESASAGLTLLPGDVISTGTPSGVAYFTGTPFLQHGDVVECELEGIGKLRNPVVRES